MPPSTLPPHRSRPRSRQRVPAFPSHRSRPNQRFRPGRQAAAVVQPADVLHNATPTTPRTARRTTRNTQPGHEPKNLLLSEEKDGGLSGTGLPPRTGAGPAAHGSSPLTRGPSPSHRSGPNQQFRPGRRAAVVVQPAGVLHGAIPPRHPVLHDERRETTSSTTTPRTFSSVKRKTGDLAELAFPLAQKQAKPTIQTRPAGRSSSSAR